MSWDEIAENLFMFKLEVMNGDVSDWPGTGIDHIERMTYPYSDLQCLLMPTLTWQLDSLLWDLGVKLEE